LPWQTTLFSQVEVTPGATTFRYYDYWATQVTAFDLHRPHQQLRVVSSSLVECSPRDAPREHLDWDGLRSAKVVDTHAELLTESRLTQVPEDLVEMTRELVDGVEPCAAAEAIASWVRDNVAYVPGSTGVQTSAQEAWELRKGVCQDIAHLTVRLLRAHEIPARYVSGYLHPKVEAEIGETVAGQSHAWVEWWCDDVPPLKGVYHGAPSKHLGVAVEITRLA